MYAFALVHLPAGSAFGVSKGESPLCLLAGGPLVSAISS